MAADQSDIILRERARRHRMEGAIRICRGNMVRAFFAHSMKKDFVLSSMSPKDFEDLCQSIEGSISKVMNAVEKGLDKAGNAANAAINQAIENQKKQTVKRGDSPTDHGSERPIYGPWSKRSIPSYDEIYSPGNASKQIIRSRFKSSGALTASGVALTSTGAIFTTTFGIAGIVGIVSSVLSVGSGALFLGGSIAGLAVIAVFFGLSIWALASGIKRLTLGVRLKAFQRIFGDREVCSIKELSDRMQMSPSKLIATARSMIKKGLLPQGRLDDDSTCLMVTNESYNLYLQAKQAYEQRMMEERTVQNAKQRAGMGSSPAGLPVKARAFIDAVNSYTQEIAALNVAIDDVELSEQIVDISITIDKIIDRVKADPSLLDSVSGLDRLDDYYLPQTVKLLTAYEELEEQPVQGENIRNSRKEIERTLNTLCKAYENLLDLTFVNMTMDVSSDITVLHAILAQEGLVDNPFDDNAKREKGLS